MRLGRALDDKDRSIVIFALDPAVGSIIASGVGALGIAFVAVYQVRHRSEMRRDHGSLVEAVEAGFRANTVEHAELGSKVAQEKLERLAADDELRRRLDQHIAEEA